MTRRPALGVAALLALVVLVVACSEPAGGGEAPELVAVLSSERVSAGAAVTLTWSASEDAAVSVDGVAVDPSGALTFSDGFDRSRTFEVVARRGGRSTERHVTLLVDVYRLAGEARLSDSAPLAVDVDDVVPGEFIVTYADDAVVPASATALVLGTAPLTRLERRALPLALEHDPARALAATLASIERDPSVRSVIPNRYVSTTATPSDAFWGEQWSLNGASGARFDIAPLWSATPLAAGSDTVIAVIDTGVLEDPQRPGSPHPDLDCDRLLPGVSFLRSGFRGDAIDGWADGGYHGSHVLGIAGACTDNAVGIAGVHPSALLLPIRVFDDGGSGTLAEVIQALRWAAGLDVPGAPANPNPADVINLSLGAGGTCDGALAAAAANATAAGAVVVAAAGNRGATGAMVPAACPTVISVGAVGPKAMVPSYSDRGALVDVFAPGGDMRHDPRGGILSTVRNATDSGYAYEEGTSMAAPHVAGVIALLRERYPELSWWQAREFLSIASDTLMISCRVTVTSSEPCPAAILDLTQAAQREPPAPSAAQDIVVLGDARFAESQVETAVQLMNVSSAAVTYVGLRSPEPALSAIAFSSSRIDPLGSMSLLLRLDRERLAPGARAIDAVLETDAGDLPLRVLLQRADVIDVGSVTISASLQRGGESLRSVQTRSEAASGYAFALDLDLAGIGAHPDDLLVLRAVADAVTATSACSAAELAGELVTPLRTTGALVRSGFRIDLEPHCESDR